MEAHQLRAARALLGLTIRELAELTGVSKTTIVNLEAGGRAHAATIEKLREVLISRGIVFIGETAPFYKSTAALRYDMELPQLGTKQKDDTDETGDAGLDARGWNDAETGENVERVKAMREYFRARPEDWQRLSEPSRKTLERTLGGIPWA